MGKICAKGSSKREKYRKLFFSTAYSSEIDAKYPGLHYKVLLFLKIPSKFCLILSNLIDFSPVLEYNFYYHFFACLGV